VTLAQSMVSTLPTYSMQNLWIPEGVCNQIDSSITQFIWGRKHSHWVNWKMITQPKSRGGLGIRTARASNISILGKHVWDLLHNPDKLWVNLLSSKYLHGISILEATNYHGSSCVWKAITKTVEVLKSGFKTRIGRGEVSLWYDKWLEDDYLCNIVPYVHISETNLRLRDIYHHGRWNFSHLTT